MTVFRLAAALFLLLAAVSACSGSCVGPEPTGFTSACTFDKCYYSEVFPAHTRHNSTDKPVVFCYSVEFVGDSDKTRGKLLWSWPLIDDIDAVFIPPNGKSLVTLGNWCDDGDPPSGRHQVVIYDYQGKVLKDYNSKAVGAAYTAWSFGAKYYFSPDGQYFYIHGLVMPPRQKDGKPEMEPDVLRFDVATGAMAKLPAGEVAYRKAIEARLKSYDLTFSSMTDIIRPEADTKTEKTK